MKKRTIYISLFLIFIIGLVSLIGTFAIDSTITEGTSSKADYLFNITLGDRTNRDILIPSYDSKIVDIKISNPNEFNMSYLLYLEGVNSNISIINISDTEVSGILNSKNTNLIKVFIQNNSSTDIVVSIKDLVGFERESLSLPNNSTAINKGPYYKAIVKSNNNDYGKVKPNIKLSTKNGTVKYTLVPNTGYQYKSTTCDGTVVDNILTISDIISNVSCEVVFEPIKVQVNLNLTGGKVEFLYTTPKEYIDISPYDATYKVELWGAQGGGTSSLPGGYGSYTSGDIKAYTGEKMYIYVGENYNGYKNSLSFNGGGKGSYSTTGSTVNYNGGGATDVRYFGTYTPTDDDLQWNSTIGLNSRIMVAAGGGGYSSWSSGIKGGSAGGLIGYDGNAIGSITVSTGGTQISGGIGADSKTSAPYAGVFGIGGYNNTYSSGYIYNSGGGGGYYGGGSGGSISGSVGSAAGGSSYISGHTGCVAITSQGITTPKSGCTSGTTDINCSVHFSGKKFANTVMIDGLGYSWTNTKGSLQRMPNPTGGYYASGIGKTGNGAARITLSSDAIYKVTYKEKYSMLPLPTKAGYTFDGWYTGENGTGTKVDENTVLTNVNDHTLYAKWIKKNVTVSFDGNKYITESNSITRNGLTFTYNPDTSYLTINGTPTANFTALNYDYGMTFNEGEKYTINTTYISGNVTNSGTGVGRAGIDVIKESLANVSTRNFASASITDKSSNGTLTVSSVGASEGTGLKYWVWFTTAADWTFTNYVIKVDVTKVESKTIQYGEKYGTMPTPTRAGYTFDGWYTGENGTGTKITSDTVLSNDNNHTLYAKWTKKNIIVSYNLSYNVSNIQNWLYANGFESRFTNSYDSSTGTSTISCAGSGGWEIIYFEMDTIANTEYEVTFEYEIPSSYKTLSGYSGIGYQALTAISNSDNSSNSLAVKYLPTSATTSAQKTTLSFKATTTKTYFALNFGMAADGVTTTIKIRNVNVKYKNTITTSYGEKYGTMPTSPARTGYTFGGWYTGTNGTGTKVTNTTLVSIGDNHSLYAKWTKVTDSTKPTCTLSANESTITATASDNVGIAYQGWSSSYSGTNETSKVITAGIHTYYVKDPSGNTNTCSIDIATTQSKSNTSYDWTSASKSYVGSCYCCKGQGGSTVGSYVNCNSSTGTCSCPSGTSICNSTCTAKYSCTWGEVVGTQCRLTYTSIEYYCDTGYVKINDSWCYK